MIDKLTKFEIKKEIAVLSASGKKSLRLNLVSWNDGPDTYDLRVFYDSSPEGRLPSKGLLLNAEEIRNLFEALREYYSAADPEGMG